MAVRQDEAVRGEKEAGTAPLALVSPRGSGAPGPGRHVDLDDGRADPFRRSGHGPGIGVQKVLIRRSPGRYWRLLPEPGPAVVDFEM
jgi:hypothetical protein